MVNYLGFAKNGAIFLKDYMTFDEALTEVLYERERILYESAVNNSELSPPPMSFDEFMEKLKSARERIEKEEND